MASTRETAVGVVTSGHTTWRLYRFARRLVATGDPQRDWTDVWTRTAPRYRRRAIFLLLLNSILFFGLGSFTYWLRHGVAVAFLNPDYSERLRSIFNPVGAHQPTLLDFVLEPINISYAPMHIIVVGLLLASLISIPILVAMLYRLPASLIFLVIIAFVAVLPWLAITLFISCALTAIRPLRFSFRFATALIALIPAVIYMVSATRNPAPAAEYVAPIESTLIYMPWVLAILASCLVMAIVLLTARLVDYRPGAISPLLAIMFAAPVILFEARVGRDELHYRLLEKHYGPHSRTHFRDEDASEVLRRLAIQKLAEFEAEGKTRDLRAIEADIAFAWQLQLESLGAADEALNVYQLQQYEAVRACDRFIDDFPHSSFLPNALYLKGRAQDTRLDVEAFRRERVLAHYQSFPSRNSRETWDILVKNYPQSPATSVALLMLAKLEAREGRVDHAIELLATLETSFSVASVSATKPIATMFSRLQKPPASKSLEIRVGELVHEGRKLRTLLESSRDPHLARPPEIPADLPLVEFLRCDPRHRLYAQNLRQLIAKYPLSRLVSRLRLEEILTGRSASLKIAALTEFLRERIDKPDTDAVPEALFRLGEAYVRDSRPQDAADLFERLVRQHPSSPWADDGRQQLGQLASLETVRVNP